MKRATGIFSAVAILAVAGQASARNYNGSDTLEVFTKQLAAACGSGTLAAKYPALAAGEFSYLGGGSGTGGAALRAGTQDIAPQSRSMSNAERCQTSIPAGPEGEPAVTLAAPGGQQQQDWAVARDGISVVTSEPNGKRCDDGITNPPASNAGITHADNAGAGDPDDLRADEDDFGASLAFANGTAGSSFPCGTWAGSTAAILPNTNMAIPLGGNIVAPTATTSAFVPSACSPDAASSYTFQDWRDVLRVLWAGADHFRFPSNAAMPAFNAANPGAAAANRQERCSSPIRQGLMANWDNIIQHLPGASCGTGADSCLNPAGTGGGPLRHVYRRDDASGTTDTFAALIGITAVGGSLGAGDLGNNEPFCNGRDTQDFDPIRVKCTTNNVNPTAITTNAQLNDETCGPDQTTGLVLAIRVPTIVGTTNTLANWGGTNVPVVTTPPTPIAQGSNQAVLPPPVGTPATAGPFVTGSTIPQTVTAAGNSHAAELIDLYPLPNCTTGAFAVRRPPVVFFNVQACPDAAPFLFTGCLTPIVELPPAGSGVATTQEANCVNALTNRAPGAPDTNLLIGGVTNDGRVWNRIVRGDRTGGHFGNGTNPSPVLRDERGLEIVRADARLRYRGTTVNGLAVPTTRLCTEVDATRDIGCLSRAADCSLGYAGREAILDRPATVTPPQPAYDGATALLLGPGAVGSNPFGPSKAQIFASIPNSTGYQFARKLYFNSIVGVNALFPAGTTFTASGGETIVGDGTRVAASPVGGPEQAQLMQCLLTEDTTTVTSPLQVALQASGFLPVRNATDARPLLDLTVPTTCP